MPIALQRRCVLGLVVVAAIGCGARSNPIPEALQLSICGNGIVEPGEDCDDGNLIATDSCTDVCKFAVCGDGITDLADGEECDDGNTDENDNCTAACRAPACGDGKISDGEA